MSSHPQPDGNAAAQGVRAVIDRLVAEGTAVGADGTVHTVFPVAASPAEGEALLRWVRREGATETVEIGLGYGVSALFVCEGLLRNSGDGGRHVALDPNQATRFANCGLRLLDEAGVGSIVEHVAGESQIVLPCFVTEGRRFDLAFVDGNHRFEGIFLDLVYLGRLVKPAGVVFVDDHQLAGVAKAVSFFLTNLGWVLEEQSPADAEHEWVVLRTPATDDTRPYDFFVDF